MHNIKVLHILSSLDSGGVERILYNYYTNMDNNYIKFDFIVHGNTKGLLEDEFLKLGSNIYHVTPKKQNFIINLLQINNVIKSNHYNIIHCHQGYSSIVPLFLAYLHKVNYRILHSHEYLPKSRVISKLLNIPYRYLIRKYANIFFACSMETSEYLYGDYLNKNYNITIIPNAIDESPFRYNQDIRNKTRHELGLDDKHILGHIGRFSTEKNHSMIINVLKEILDSDDNWILLLIGDGKKFKEIKKLVSDMGLSSKVIFLGKQINVSKYLQAMDCFIMPSYNEGFGIALLEAQAAGLQCYASNSIPQNVNITGLVDFLNIEDSPKIWAEHIINSFNIHSRTSQMDKFKTSKYNIKNVSTTLEKIYIDIMTNKDFKFK